MKAKIYSVIVLAGLVLGCGRETETTKESVPEKKVDASVAEKAPTKPTKTGDPTPRVEQKEPKRPRPNIVLVLIDTLRPDYLGFYGFRYETAAFLGGLSDESVVFENALSTTSWTAPATASMFTSLYPPQHGITQGFRAHRSMAEKIEEQEKVELELNQMPFDRPTLPERLKKEGYRTFGAATNINIGESMGFTRGFDKFYRRTSAPAEQVHAKVKEWRNDIVGDTPFFLYLHLNDVHSPYDFRRGYYKRRSSKENDDENHYRSEIGYVDEYIGKIWNLPGISENTILVVVSDHGEEFLDHGGTLHGATLYQELQHVLFMVYGKDVGLAPKRVKENVSIVDIGPTLLDWVGIEMPEKHEGMSLKWLLTSENAPSDIEKTLRERCLYGHRAFSEVRKISVWSITCENYKLIDWWGERNKLFDHETDFTEMNDISRTRTDVTERLQKQMDVFKKRMKEHKHISTTTEVEINKEVMEQLQNLGYVE